MSPPPYPPRLDAGITALRDLARHERYRAAFIFGSAARGEANERSDLDAKVIVDHDNPCTEINHPTVGGVRFDLTFISLAQLRRDTAREIDAARRVPMVAESVILFDKDGDLAALRAEAAVATPPRATEADYFLLRFLLRHTNQKVVGAIDHDPASALLAMHLGLAELLDLERRLAGTWEVSSKRVLPQLRERSPELAALVERFVVTGELSAKYALWQQVVAAIAAPLGDWTATESVCDCATCRADLAALLGAQDKVVGDP